MSGAAPGHKGAAAAWSRKGIGKVNGRPGVIAGLTRAIQYPEISMIERQAAAYRITRMRG
jgi:hypothetical protein